MRRRVTAEPEVALSDSLTGLVTRRVYAEVPPRVEYSLTEKGRELEGIVSAISAWADKWGSACEAALARH